MPASTLASAQPASIFRPRARALLPAAIAAAFTAQCLWFIGTQSLTYDEVPHIAAGLDAWRHGRFELWNDQPPLGRLLVTAPLAIGSEPWELENRGATGANFWSFSIRPRPTLLAWRTRPANVAAGLALMWLLWTTTRRLVSEVAANVALALFAFSPALVAHFSLATVDGVAVLLLFATAVALERWRSRASWPATCGVGLALGGLLLAKYSAPPIVALVLVVMVASRRVGGGRIAKSAAALAIALVTVWATFLFHVGPVTFRNGSLDGPYGRSGTVIVPVSRPLDVTVRLPAPEYVAALGGVAQHAARGQPSFLLGEIKERGGWPLYFSFVVLLKWPPTLWLMVAMAIVMVARRRGALSAELATMMVFPVVFFALAMTTRLNIGDRYVLPVYPFLLMGCGILAETVRHWRRGAVMITMLIALQAVDVARYAPDYLSYLNPIVPSDRGYEWLSDSNLDWGQGLLALREYQRAHPNQRLHLAYFGGVDPQSYGIDAEPLGERDRPRGTAVVSATHLSGQYLHDPTAYHWLLGHRTAVLNHSLHVFEVP